MKKSIHYLFAILLTLAVAACSEKPFKIDGKLSDGATQNLRAIYLTGDSIHSEWVPAVNGQFSISGQSDSLTVVYIYSSQMKELAHIAVENGDEIQMEGNPAERYALRVKGSELNEEWYGFLNRHAADFAAGNTEKTDKAIAEFVKGNPDNVLSTLLLTCDYSDCTSAEGRKLMEEISENARPRLLTALYDGIATHKTPARKRLTTLSLRGQGDTLRTVKPDKGKVAVLFLWKKRNRDRFTIVKQLKALPKAYVDVIDICIDADTIGWWNVIRNDSVRWPHYKAPGGPVDRSLEPYDIKGSPFFVVADTAGNELYRGNSADEACRKANEKALSLSKGKKK